MENASKALIIAGGILIAILIIGMLVITMNSISDYQESGDRKQKEEQIVKYNKQFEAYSRNIMRGSDIISVIYKVINNNLVYGDDNFIKLSIKYYDDSRATKNITINSSGDMSAVKTKTQGFEKDITFKSKYFKCTNTGYNSSTGKINSLIIEERTDVTFSM